ncbi:sn-glycerol-3-phosphate ABC transporter ATP-binding protein UgpC [Ramlibacter ginsenosidimutans]|uniref:Sn-glycerol-3-phosphate ABC transporter ATP-binding protein UgpC n=1 Tax=Ramlibacter ginsenosidimutans TaxID=502333 RepID=A0A934TXD3_9BURK|nr:sn-glycerol-3-phosphate ABC transporter ATP-binding protein UgpC [Ramlibacter ginsenosidimutans]MBK6008866.1 sn-glycerol-3-phosphate ABC transporter ATP-binding protein UgpC [Ramlibacter ginsenosidimutans]
MASVSFRGVEKQFGRFKVIHGISFDIQDGEFVVLVGPSGCGKSTLLRMLAGLEPITGGEIDIDRRVVNELDSKDRDIAMVFQSYALYPHMTVRDNMAFSLKLRKADTKLTAQRVDNAARILNLTQLLDRYPRELSGGQRQRVAMGRAIVRDPKVFLFDEPLSNLDAKLRVAMRAEIKALHQRLKTTTVYVTHDQIEAMTMADRIVVMHDGLVEQIGTPLELFDRPGNLFVAQFIGSPSMNVMAGTLRQGESGSWVEAQGQRWPTVVQAQGQDGQSVQYGVRPGDLRLSTTGQGIPAKVVVVEPTGAETELLLKVGDADLVCVLHGRTNARADDTVMLEVAPEKTHVFDAAGGQRLDTLPPRLQ